MGGHRVLRLDELEPRRDPDTGADWLTLRHALGVAAFGLNAWRAAEVGIEVIERHTEADTAHQEVYVVVSGRARFSVGGDEIPAPAGTVVFVEDPALERAAVAEEAGTVVLAIGAAPGREFSPSDWETQLLGSD